MKLFNEYEAMNEDGKSLNEAVAKAMKPIIAEWLSKGCSPADVQYIIMGEISISISELKLIKAAFKRKQEKVDALSSEQAKKLEKEKFIDRIQKKTLDKE